jgi:S1-C subfamily serine protease
MTIRVSCPACDKEYNLDDAVRGKKVRCRACQAVIDVPAGRADRGADRPAREERVAPPPPRAASPRDDDEDERPRRRTDVRARDDRDDRPRAGAARRPRDDDDDDYRPRQGGSAGRAGREESKGGGNLLLILVGVGVAGVLLLGGLVGGLVWAFSGPSGNAPVAEAKPAAAGVVAPNAPPLVKPPVAQAPAPGPGPAPADITPDVVRRVKGATAYLRVKLPGGGVSQGSGFFALERGIVITNAHVLGMLRADSLSPKSVEVVIDSGEPGEAKRTGTVLGVDRTNDLAVLRVEGDPSGLPAPLPVESAKSLTETQKVYVFGFPFGASLGKNITVSHSTITSLRKDDNGQLKQLQVGGGMNPGNSGGPVTDARGVVVGVSVSIIVGTQINFAIPGDFVKQVIDGKVTRTETGYAYRGEGGTRLPVTLTCLDPMNRVRQVKAEVWTGPPGVPLPPSDAPPAARPGDGPRQSFTLTVRDGRYTADVLLPAPAAGQVVWVQPVLVNGAGVTQYDASVGVPAEVQDPLERRAVTIRFQAPSAPVERTLKLNNDKKYTLYRGQKSATFEDKMQGNAVEALSPEPKGTRCRLLLGDCPYTSQVGDRVMAPPAPARDLLRRYSPSFLLSADHACATATKHHFRNLRSPFRDAVAEMYEAVCNAYEGTTLPVPNREVRPGETWKARMPLYVRSGGKIMVQHAHLVCTFEGVSTAGGQNEALVSIKGRVKGIKQLADVELGKVHGTARVNLDGGFVSRVKLTTITELENEDNDARLLVQAESTVERTPGNSLGLTPPVEKPTPPAPPTGTPGDRPAGDVAALKGTWQSGTVTGAGGLRATIKVVLQPSAAGGGKGRIELSARQGRRTVTTKRNFTFDLTRKGNTRKIVGTGAKGGLSLTYRLTGEQLVLHGPAGVVADGFALNNLVFRRVSEDAPGLPAGDPTKPVAGGKGSPNALTFTGDVFDFVQAAVTENRLAEVDVRGFPNPAGRYKDVPKEGGVLIGFQYGLGKFVNKVIVKSFRPIYLTKAGEKLGPWQGPEFAAPMTVKAKEGYVVSKVSIRTSLGVSGFTLTFAKLGKTGLDLTDAYDSPAVGNTKDHLSTIGGKGQLFVGITGHLTPEKAPSSLGLMAVLPKE